MNKYEAIFIDRNLILVPRPPGEHFLINGMIFARRHSQLFLILARQAFVNLAAQLNLEQQYGYVAYHCARLAGGELITEVVFEPGSCNRIVRADFAARILIVPEEAAPVVRGVHNAYKMQPELHWSARQQREPLFEPVREPAPSRIVHFHNLHQTQLLTARLRIASEIAGMMQAEDEAR